MFLIALGVFVVASALGGLVDDGSLLIATRFVKGVSAAFTAPAGLSIITTSFAEGPMRNRALSIYAATGATGFSLGLVFGGLLTEIGWRWVFLLPAPIALITLIAAFRLVPDSGRPAGARRGFDLAGAVTLTASMLLLVFTVVEAPDAGWASVRTLGSFVAVAVLLTAFVAHRAAHRPAAGAARHPALGVARAGEHRRDVADRRLVRLPVRRDPLHAAAARLVAARDRAGDPAGRAAGGAHRAAPRPRSITRFGPGPLISAGLLSTVAAYALFLPIGLDSPYATAILPTMLLGGLGFALAYGPLNIAATNGIAPEEQGLAGGLLNTSFQFGGALVLAIGTAVAEANAGTGGSPQDLLDGFVPAVAVSLIVAVIGFLATTVRRPQARLEADPASPA